MSEYQYMVGFDKMRVEGMAKYLKVDVAKDEATNMVWLPFVERLVSRIEELERMVGRV